MCDILLNHVQETSPFVKSLCTVTGEMLTILRRENVFIFGYEWPVVALPFRCISFAFRLQWHACLVTGSESLWQFTAVMTGNFNKKQR